MRVVETYTGFTGNINAGKHCLFIKTGGDGVELGVEELLKQVVHFSYVEIIGGEPFKDREDIAKLIEKANKENPYVTYIINTKGLIRPIRVGNFNNIIYNVNLQLSSESNTEFKQRIVENIVQWYSESNANFIFNIGSIDDLDEAIMLVRTFNIKKKQVFLRPTNKYGEKKCYKVCKLNGYNIYPNYVFMVSEELK